MRGDAERQDPEPVDDVVRWIQQHEPPLHLDLEAGLKAILRQQDRSSAARIADGLDGLFTRLGEPAGDDEEN